jgi:predicted  nucleic acid-binding Zn-ribbon protein
MDLIEQLSVLIKMQAVDKNLYVLEVEAAEIPVRLGGLSLEEDRLKQSLAVAQAELDQVTARRKSLEADNEAIRARLRKAESRLMGAKTQREYRAATADM